MMVNEDSCSSTMGKVMNEQGCGVSLLEEQAKDMLRQLNSGQETRMTEAELNSHALTEDLEEDGRRFKGGEEALLAQFLQRRRFLEAMTPSEGFAESGKHTQENLEVSDALAGFSTEQTARDTKRAKVSFCLGSDGFGQVRETHGGSEQEQKGVKQQIKVWRKWDGRDDGSSFGHFETVPPSSISALGKQNEGSSAPGRMDHQLSPSSTPSSTSVITLQDFAVGEASDHDRTYDNLRGNSSRIKPFLKPDTIIKSQPLLGFGQRMGAGAGGRAGRSSPAIHEQQLRRPCQAESGEHQEHGETYSITREEHAYYSPPRRSNNQQYFYEGPQGVPTSLESGRTRSAKVDQKHVHFQKKQQPDPESSTEPAQEIHKSKVTEDDLVSLTSELSLSEIEESTKSAEPCNLLGMYDSLEFRAILASYEMRNKLEKVAKENERLKKAAARFQKKLCRKQKERELVAKEKFSRTSAREDGATKGKNVTIIPILREADEEDLVHATEKNLRGHEKVVKDTAKLLRLRSASEPRPADELSRQPWGREENHPKELSHSTGKNEFMVYRCQTQSPWPLATNHDHDGFSESHQKTKVHDCYQATDHLSSSRRSAGCADKTINEEYDQDTRKTGLDALTDNWCDDRNDLEAFEVQEPCALHHEEDSSLGVMHEHNSTISNTRTQNVSLRENSAQRINQKSHDCVQVSDTKESRKANNSRIGTNGGDEGVGGERDATQGGTLKQTAGDDCIALVSEASQSQQHPGELVVHRDDVSPRYNDLQDPPGRCLGTGAGNQIHGSWAGEGDLEISGDNDGAFEAGGNHADPAGCKPAELENFPEESSPVTASFPWAKRQQQTDRTPPSSNCQFNEDVNGRDGSDDVQSLENAQSEQKPTVQKESLPAAESSVRKSSLSQFVAILKASHGLLCPKAHQSATSVYPQEPPPKGTSSNRISSKNGGELSLDSKAFSSVIIVAKKINHISRSKPENSADGPPKDVLETHGGSSGPLKLIRIKGLNRQQLCIVGPSLDVSQMAETNA